MAYTISTSDNSVNITIPDGQFDNSTLLTLSGPNTVGYGLYLDQNQLLMLENFASNTQPDTGKSVQGQLWFDKTAQVLNVYTSTGYRSVNGITVGPGAPVATSTTVAGNTWFDNVADQLYFYNGSNWTLIGPNYTAQQGISGILPVQVSDAGLIGTHHNVLEMRYGATIIAIISSDASFTPTPAIPGFPVINQGITFNNGLLNTTINSNLVGSVTGNVTGNLTGNVAGSLTGLQVNTTNVYNTGDLTSLTAEIGTATATNFSSGNIAVTGGTISGLTDLETTSGATVNFPGAVSVGVVTSTSGTASSFTNLNTTHLNSTTAGLTTVNSVYVNAVTLGNTGASLIATNGIVTTLVAPNFSSGNIQATGGTATGLTNISATNVNAQNLVSVNAQLSGGAFSGITSISTGSLTSSSTTLNGTITLNGTVNSTQSNYISTFKLLQADNFYSGTVTAATVNAPTIGNAGTVLNGTLTTINQPNIQYIGRIVGGTWQASVIGPLYGGTGVQNNYTLTVSGANRTLNQDVTSGASPVFVGTNFSGTASSLTVGAAQALTTSNFTFQQSGSKVILYFNSFPIFSIDSSGNMRTTGDIIAFASA